MVAAPAGGVVAVVPAVAVDVENASVNDVVVGLWGAVVVALAVAVSVVPVLVSVTVPVAVPVLVTVPV